MGNIPRRSWTWLYNCMGCSFYVRIFPHYVCFCFFFVPWNLMWVFFMWWGFYVGLGWPSAHALKQQLQCIASVSLNLHLAHPNSLSLPSVLISELCGVVMSCVYALDSVFFLYNLPLYCCQYPIKYWEKRRANDVGVWWCMRALDESHWECTCTWCSYCLWL